MPMKRALLFLSLLICVSALAEELPLLYKESFKKGAGAWHPSDTSMWTVDKQKDGNHVYHLHGKSAYVPPVRSPHSVTLLKDHVVGDFVLTAKVRTLQTPRAHRDMCLFWGYQNSSNFYYVHLGQATDPHANQVFIVKDEPRIMITEKNNEGTPWKDGKWHQVKIVRKVKSGLIEVYFDDMEKPQQVAHDKSFQWGLIGLGSFDDLGLWDDIELRGEVIEKKPKLFKSVAGKKKVKAKKPAAKSLGKGEFKSVKASASQQGNPAANAVDGKTGTKWAANGEGQWIQVELPKSEDVQAVTLGFISGHRKYSFEITTSMDGKKWGKSYEFLSGGHGDGLASYPIQKTKARFVRVTVNGNSENDWANIHTLSLKQVGRSAPKQAEKKSKAADPSQLKFTKWSGDVNVPDPVAISLDPKGVAYVTQTQRRKIQDLDIRSNRDWIPNDVGFQSVAEKKAFFHERLATDLSDDNEHRVKDMNNDGVNDWEDLTVLSENIWRLEDTDGDGKADDIKLFAEDFKTEVTGIAAGVLYHDGWVYATIAPDVWRMRDTDGDGIVDEREVIAHGFGLHIAYGGHDMHGLRVGPDGRIYWSIGDKGISVVSKEGKKFHFPNQGGVMRCDPDGSNFEVFAHGLRNVQEMDFDEYGNWFGVDNDADQPGEKERFVYIVQDMDAGWRCNYQYRGSGYNPWTAEKVWQPYQEGHAAYFVPPIQNYNDGPAGFLYNPGTALSPAYKNYFFLTGAPRGDQWAFQAESDGASFAMINSHQIGNGVPLVGINFGSDGAIYGVDWGGGYPLNQKGAVWTIDVPEYRDSTERRETKEILENGFAKRKQLELVKLLGHEDKRVRLGAQFELVKRDRITPLKNALNGSKDRLTRIHSIWGIGQLARRGNRDAQDTLIGLLEDADEEIQVQAVKTLRDVPSRLVDASRISKLLSSDNTRLQFHTLLTLSKHPDPNAFATITKIAAKNTKPDLYLRHGVISALSSLKRTGTLARHSSEEVRLCAVVALRRNSDPAVASFLKSTPAVAVEAAMAIHDDFSIPEALPALADSLGSTSLDDERFIRRAINANLRLGKPANAVAVAQYASLKTAPLALRQEALDTLADWVKPDVLDRVDGRRRDLIPRETAPIAGAIAGQVSEVLESGENALVERAIGVSDKLGIQLEKRGLQALLKNNEMPGSLRVVALSSLKSGDAIEYALNSKEALLRIEAARQLADKDAERTIEYLTERLAKSSSISEKQAAFGTLAKIGGSKVQQIVSVWAKRLSKGDVHAALHLDVVEAAETLKLESAMKGYLAKRVEGNVTSQYLECLEGGDAERGKEIFNTHLSAQCVRCHKAGDGKGSIIGPNLKNAGSKERSHLLESLVDPQAKISKGYGLVTILLKNGETVGGQFRKETDKQIEVRLPDGKTVKVKKADIDQQTPVVSVMPPMVGLLTKHEIRDLMEFLSSLKTGK